jgi:hypothetical protein
LGTKISDSEMMSSDLTRPTARAAEGGQRVRHPRAPGDMHAGLAGSVPAVVPAPRLGHPAAAISDGSVAAQAATVSHLSQQVRTADRADRGPHSANPQPVSASPAEGGADSSAEARVAALDGSERKLLLGHLARAYPDVVDAGFAWLAEYHAAVAERRRVASNRKSQERRRRQRAAGLR